MDGALRWLLTYLLHSSVLLGTAFLLRVALRQRQLALQEAVLRAALVGGLVTASLSLGLGLRPLAGRVELAATPRGGALAAGAGTLAQPGQRDVGPPAPVAARPAPRTAAPSRTAGPDGSPTAAVVAPRPVVRAQPSASARGARADAPAPAPRTTPGALAAGWRHALLGAWAFLAAAGLLRLGTAHVRLRRLLRARRPTTDAELRRDASRLALALGLRRVVPVHAVAGLSTPLATGILHPEVCLPPRALRDLASEERAALCAHELAHVARRDPAWILVARLVEAIAPFQPLNRWARGRLADLAEFLSDDLAVRASGGAMGLARSLVDVASWAVPDRALAPTAASGALARRSRLGHRVERLMNPLRTLERPRRFFLPVSGLAVLLTTLITPVVSGRSAPPSPEPPAAPRPVTAPKPPEPAPAAPAAPRPAAAPRPPRAPDAPAADALDLSGMEREMARMGARLQERMQRHQQETAALQAEMQRLAERVHPHEEELQRLAERMHEAAAGLAEATQREAGDAQAAAGGERARAQLDELRRRMQAVAHEMRPAQDELRAMADRARALAQAARPDEGELRELRRMARDLARQAEATGHAAPEAAHGAARELAAEMRRAAVERRRVEEDRERVHEELRRAQEELQRTREELRRTQEELARAREQR